MMRADKPEAWQRLRTPPICAGTTINARERQAANAKQPVRCTIGVRSRKPRLNAVRLRYAPRDDEESH
jgi:hypothetical protein